MLYAIPFSGRQHCLCIGKAFFVNGAYYRNARLIDHVSNGLFRISHLLLPGFFMSFFDSTTIACGFAAGSHGLKDRCRAADSGIHFYCAETAISLAGPAFHAGVFINQNSPFIQHVKDIVRAYLDTPRAALALLGIESEAGYIFKISHMIPHCLILYAMNMITETAIAALYTGMEYLISFLTPEMEVNVVAPVNCSARYDEKAGKTRRPNTA